MSDHGLARKPISPRVVRRLTTDPKPCPGGCGGLGTVTVVMDGVPTKLCEVCAQAVRDEQVLRQQKAEVARQRRLDEIALGQRMLDHHARHGNYPRNPR